MQDNIRRAGEDQAASTYDDFSRHLLLAGHKLQPPRRRNVKVGSSIAEKKKTSQIVAVKDSSTLNQDHPNVRHQTQDTLKS